MSAQAEAAFIKSFLNTISAQPVTYANDFQQPPENSLKKIPVLPVELPPIPRTAVAEPITPSSASISLTFKSTKPSASFTLSVQPTDTISSIKSQLSKLPSAPPADAQRLLLKGKALADNKLLQEYPVRNGDTVNLMVKPGFDWNPSSSTTSTTPSQPMNSPSLSTADKRPHSATLEPEASNTSQPSKRHQRIPSVVLSPSPSNESPGLVDKPITLTLDSTPSAVGADSVTGYHSALANPEFWERLHIFLRSELNDDDALHAFEDFLRASKSTLTAFEIAKIRDHVGVVGMAGT